MRRCHIGCGSVYLRPSIADDPDSGWINVDLPGDGRFLAQERGDLVRELGTPEADYYGKSKRHSTEDFTTPIRSEIVVDKFGSFEETNIETQSVDEVLSRQVFEHLSIREARRALVECDRILVNGGLLRLSVPDHDAIAAKLATAPDEFTVRHFLGSFKDDFSIHVASYTRDGLRRLVESLGFEFEAEESNIHLYPAICMRFRKPGPHAHSWEYAVRRAPILDAIPAGWKCIDIGAGCDPWPRADTVLDVAPPATLPGQQAIIADAGKPLPFADKQFDFAISCHMVEHLVDPVAFARELSRIARRGIIVAPRAGKDMLFGCHEPDHLWQFEERKGRLICWRPDPAMIESLRDENFSRAMHRILRLGPSRFEEDALACRKWFRRNEVWLDVVHEWEGELKVEVIE